MEKLWFKSDYQEGACPEILKRFTETAFEPLSGYGTDIYCKSAGEKIKKAIGCENAQVKFICGGTQTNQLVISSMLKSYEGVVAAQTGHIAAHEAGAIEYSGHKVLTLPQHEGKILCEELSSLLEKFWNDDSHDHMVYPGMVYISHPTEFGTLYTKEELTKISAVCREYKIPLYLDGARLAYGLMSEEAELDIKTIAELCDVFYIGGTKVGALCGEAVVFTNNNMPCEFVPQIKQRGALMAKGWVLGLQFDTLFTDDLYYRLGAHAIEMANLLKEGLVKKGYTLYADSPTNQQFVIITNEKRDELCEKAVFENWEKFENGTTAVRFVTSWATKRENVEKLLELL
ncbi:MAG: low specificity L-threonine aldolase [Eubacteriales bacterium]|nr:low specificity L-threonine aldolase [Eubacteriales bacterium]